MWQKRAAVPETGSLIVLGRASLHFPVSLVLRCGYVTNLWPVESGHKRCTISRYAAVMEFIVSPQIHVHPEPQNVTKIKIIFSIPTEYFSHQIWERRWDGGGVPTPTNSSVLKKHQLGVL